MSHVHQRLQIEPRIEDFLERSYRMSKSYPTKRSHRITLNKLQVFCGTKEKYLSEILYDLKEKKLDPISLLDEFYSFLARENKKNTTIASYLSIVKDFLNFHELHIYNEDIKQRFRIPKKEIFYEEGLTKDILNRLLHNSSYKLQVATLVLCSSGMRVGELVQLRLSDIDFTTNPTTIKIRRETTKTRETRFTHLTSEASKILSDYVTKKVAKENNDDPFLFMKNGFEPGSLAYFNAWFSARQNISNMLKKAIGNVPELSMKNENGSRRIHFHAFRKWFKTQVTIAGQSDFAEALMGHKSLKLVYFKQSSEARRKLYLKMEPFLTISDFTKVEKTMDELQEQVQSLTQELEKVKQWREISIKYPKK